MDVESGVEAESIRLASRLGALTECSFNQSDVYVWIWKPDATRSLTARTVTLCCQEVACRLVWRSILPFKVHVFAWKLLPQWLPTSRNLVARNILPASINLSCVFCFNSEELEEHFFYNVRLVQSCGKKYINGLARVAHILQHNLRQYGVKNKKLVPLLTCLCRSKLRFGIGLRLRCRVLTTI
jgi:hypothetical protein